jgi:hypothetical protein
MGFSVPTTPFSGPVLSHAGVRCAPLLARSGDAAAVRRRTRFQVAALLPGAWTRGVAVPWLSWGNGGPVAPGPAPVCREEQVRGCLLAVRRTTRLQGVRRLPLRDEAAAARHHSDSDLEGVGGGWLVAE